MGLGILAALTPPEDEVIYTDEVVRRFDLERDLKDVDLVGDQRRQQDGAPELRHRRRVSRGAACKVVLGGIHATACPEEARAARRRVVVGEAEDAWPRLARRRARAARSSPIYRPPLPDLGRPAAGRGATSSARGATSPSRSCRRCAAAPTRASSAACRRPTARPCASGRRTTCSPSSRALGKLIMFADDNVMIHRAYSRISSRA